jgi:predicted transcriptional regulator
MTTLTVNIDNEKDLTALEEFLTRSGLDYSIDEEDEALEASLKQGLLESEQGLGRPHTEVMSEIKARYGL